MIGKLSGTTLGGLASRLSAVVAQTVAVVVCVWPVHAVARTVHELTTPSGIAVWLAEEHSIPLVALRFSFDGGALRDPPGKEGLAGLMAALVTEGAGDLDSQAFARRMADEGAEISVSAARDQVYGGLDVIAKRLPEAADLLRLTVTAPRFDADSLERVRTQRRSDLELAASDPKSIAFNRWYAESFPGHPYGRPVNGEPKTLAALTRADAVAAHRQLFVRRTLKVVIVGDLDKAAAIEQVERIFGSLPRGEPLPALAKVDVKAFSPALRITMNQPLATAAFGTAALAVRDPQYPALQVLRQIVGSGDFDSTLMDEIRVKRGLAYSVSLSLLHDQTASIMLGGMSTKNESMNKALDVLREVLSTIAANGPNDAAFENAKRYLTGSYLLDLDTNAKLAGSLLGLWLDGRTPSFIEQRNQLIERVTLADVKGIAARILEPSRLNITVVGRLEPAR